MAQERTWRHLDTMQFETVFAARVPRAGKRGPFIWMFEAFAPMTLEASRCVEAARRGGRLSWDAVHVGKPMGEAEPCPRFITKLSDC